MLFTGEYEHTIDAKQRLAIPADIRSRLNPESEGLAFYLAPGPNGTLWMWPERTFERMAATLEQTLLPSEEMVEFEQLLFSQATRMEIDQAGRVRLPKSKLDEAGIVNKVVILGVRDHLELREPEQWYAIRRDKVTQQMDIMLRARRAMSAQSNANGGGKDAG